MAIDNESQKLIDGLLTRLTSTEKMGRAEFERRYPAGNYDLCVDSEKKIAAYFAKPQDEISADLVAAADENRAKGLSNE